MYIVVCVAMRYNKTPSAISHINLSQDPNTILGTKDDKEKTQNNNNNKKRSIGVRETNITTPIRLRS